LHLQGSLFFGSVEQLTTKIREFALADPSIQSVVIDFSGVNSFDSSACAAMDKLIHVLDGQDIAAHITGVPAGLTEVFKRWGLPLADRGRVLPNPAFHVWLTLDEALEHCESALIAGHDAGKIQHGIGQTLLDLGRNHKRCGDLLALMEQVRLAAGDALILASQQEKDVFFVVSGQMGVHLPASSGNAIRVRSMGPGTIVGEIAYLTGHPRNADVICEEDAEVLKLSEASIKRLEENDRDLAALLMLIFSRSLAAKLAQTNSLLTYSQSLSASGR
ncbi:MAG: cyclic nucleotide-binding domain-containing protein, partial [Phyllobacteriaceae bacterium]|nr:cyclic nucleotide-binding domain-containing protein [Phyllobacteriaceae bacterium]